MNTKLVFILATLLSLDTTAYAQQKIEYSKLVLPPCAPPLGELYPGFPNDIKEFSGEGYRAYMETVNLRRAVLTDFVTAESSLKDAVDEVQPSASIIIFAGLIYINAWYKMRAANGQSDFSNLQAERRMYQSIIEGKVAEKDASDAFAFWQDARLGAESMRPIDRKLLLRAQLAVEKIVLDKTEHLDFTFIINDGMFRQQVAAIEKMARGDVQ